MAVCGRMLLWVVHISLHTYWSDRFGGMRILPSLFCANGTLVVMEERVNDQAELAGILKTLDE